jgi:FHS family L-fucose permease-like MFS transporter
MKLQSQLTGAAAGRVLVPLVIFLFFIRGFCTVLIETLVPKLKGAFQLSYAEVMLTQLCFFLGYFFFSLPAAVILARLGYFRAIMVGLAVMIAGCMIFSPASLLHLYPGFLFALFVVAAGITILQVATNPFISTLGSTRSSHSRLTLAHAFNSVGTTLAPFFGAWLIFGSINPIPSPPPHRESMNAIWDGGSLQVPFLAIAALLTFAALLFWFCRHYPAPKTRAIRGSVISWFDLLKNRRFSLGAVSIFLYVGAEVSVGSILINYLMLDSVLAVSPSTASELASLYWGGAMIGRFIGSAALRIVLPNIALIFCALFAAVLAITSSLTDGASAAVAIIAIGLCNSIMFPTIFAMALEDVEDHRPQGSGILSMAIVGGAIVPIVTGLAADRQGLASALLVPAACYMWIAFYGVKRGTRPVPSIEAV